MKGALASSSGTLYTAAKKINHSGIERSQQLSVISSNENLFVRLEIRNQVETALLQVVKKLHHQEEEGTIDEYSCTVRSRYLLPCSHQTQLGLPLDVTHIHPRWRVHPTFPAVNITSQNDRPDVLSGALPRKGRPRGTRRLQTSAEIIQKVADGIEKVRRCRSCHKAGHTRHKCSNLLDQQSSQGTDEGGFGDTALEEDEVFHNQ
ncbi:hypothetical protein V1522DRAFT_437744 [Lipomyces starkeyi]